MTFRITRVDTESESGTVLRIAGDLHKDDISELENYFRGSKFPLTIDLSEVTHADKEAAAALSRLSTEGANLVGASPYLSMLLDSAKESRGGFTNTNI